VSFRSQHTHFQKPVFNWLSSDILRSSLWLLNVVDVNLIFILRHFLLLHILIDVIGSRLIRTLLELGDLSAVVILNLELTVRLRSLFLSLLKPLDERSSLLPMTSMRM
jgi:hypothetical protein